MLLHLRVFPSELSTILWVFPSELFYLDGYVNTSEGSETLNDIAEVFDFAYIKRGAYKKDQMKHLIKISKRYWLPHEM